MSKVSLPKQFLAVLQTMIYNFPILKERLGFVKSALVRNALNFFYFMKVGYL